MVTIMTCLGLALGSEQVDSEKAARERAGMPTLGVDRGSRHTRCMREAQPRTCSREGGRTNSCGWLRKYLVVVAAAAMGGRRG